MPRKIRFTPEDIVDTAFQLLREGGWEGLTAAAVAHRLGCSTMPIYSHFKNKKDLQEAALEKAWDLLMERETAVVTGDPWVDQGIAYTRFAREEPHLFHCMFDGRHGEKGFELRRRNWHFLAQQLEDYAPFAGLDEELASKIRMSRALFSHGIATAVTSGWFRPLQDREVAERWIQVVSRSLLHGMKELFEELEGEPLPLCKPDDACD